MAATQLILHVGTTKTGSSALQSALALSIDVLAAQGIHYPDHQRLEAARLGHITAGNVTADTFVETARSARDAGFDRVLMSSEDLFRHLGQTPEVLAEVAGFYDEVTCIAYLRDPIDWILSDYGQLIKRGGATLTLDEYLEVARIPDLPAFMAAVEGAGATARVRNYSRYKKTLVPDFEAALGLEAGTLNVPPRGQVNRSLTRAESFVQMKFNEHWGRESSRFVSDVLCNELPDIRSEVARCSPEAFEAFVARITPDVEACNAYLPEAEPLVIETYAERYGDAEEETQLSLEPAQVDVLVKSVAGRLLSSEDRDALRQVAIRLKPGEPLSDADAATLLKLTVSQWPEAKQLAVKAESFAKRAAGETPVDPAEARRAARKAERQAARKAQKQS